MLWWILGGIRGDAQAQLIDVRTTGLRHEARSCGTGPGVLPLGLGLSVRSSHAPHARRRETPVDAWEIWAGFTPASALQVSLNKAMGFATTDLQGAMSTQRHNSQQEAVLKATAVRSPLPVMLSILPCPPCLLHSGVQWGEGVQQGEWGLAGGGGLEGEGGLAGGGGRGHFIQVAITALSHGASP